jgi:hypothetical protein
MLVFDIETGPLDEEFLDSQFVPKTKEEFVGAQRWKPETVEAKYAEYLESAKQKFIRDAALDATTGQVVAIGYKLEKDGELIDDGYGSEENLLRDFWKTVKEESCSKVGHNILGFDLPFLIRRSWILGVEFDMPKLDRGGQFIDTMRVWTCGSYGDFIGLNRLAKCLGIQGKSTECTGADLARLWKGSQEEREMAERYLFDDLRVTWDVAVRLGVL